MVVWGWESLLYANAGMDFITTLTSKGCWIQKEFFTVLQTVTHLIKMCCSRGSTVEPVAAVTFPVLLNLHAVSLQILPSNLCIFLQAFFSVSISSPTYPSSLPPSLPTQSPASPSVPPVRAAKIKWCHFSMTL